MSEVSWEAKVQLGKFLTRVMLDVQVGNEKNQAILNPESGRLCGTMRSGKIYDSGDDYLG